MSESVSRAIKMNEAVARMESIGMSQPVIDDFRRGTICESLENGFEVAPLRDCESELVRQFEDDYNAVVYHVIETWTPYVGFMKSYMYVSDCPEEWKDDAHDLRSGETLAYVRNLSYSRDSEFGSIGFELQPNGSLVRTW